MEDQRLRRYRRLGLVVLTALLTLAVTAGAAQASHFRYGNLNWQKAGPAAGGSQPVTFQNEQSWRASAFGNPSVGDVIPNGEGCINFGDGNSVCPQYRVTFVNNAEDYVIMHALAPGSTTDRNVPHTYTSPGPFTATTSSCCTISTLNNANDASWQVQTLVNLADDESAKSTVPPIVQLPEGGTQTFTVPAIDAGGETKRFRLSTANESCFGCGTPHPPGLTIDPNTGQVTWDTTGRDNGLGLWWTGVVVESLVGNNVVSSTQIQYIIRVGGAAGNQSPVWDDSVTPPDGTVFTVNPGQVVSFNLKANDPDAGDTVSIAQNSGPGTLTPVNGNPATASFSYTAQASDIGNDQTVQFLAQDNGNPPLGPPFRSYTIRVVAQPPGDTTVPGCRLSGTGTDNQGKKYIEATAQDGGSGLQSIQVLKSTNANTVVPAFTPGTTDPVVVRATKIDPSKSSTLMIRATDVAGNTVTCDPELVRLKIGRKGVARYVLKNMPYAEHHLKVMNGGKGVRKVQINVNGRSIKRSMGGKAQRLMNLRAFMTASRGNTITLTAYGKPGRTVTFLLHD